MHKILSYTGERKGEREKKLRKRGVRERERENYIPPFLTTVSLMSGTGVLSSSVASAKSSPVMSSSSTATIRSPGHSLPSRWALPSSNISSMIRPPCNNQHKINDITQNMINIIFHMDNKNCTHIIIYWHVH